MANRIEELRERMSQLSTPELIRILTEDSGDYIQEALQVAFDELKIRGESLPVPNVLKLNDLDDSGVDEASPEEIANAYKHRDSKCRDCGGKLRYEALQSGTEVVLSFFDTHELRYLEVDVCVSCRKVTFRADMESEV
jgi:hypothetical protein